MARDSGSGIGTLLTWGAVAGGAYLIYQWWAGQGTTAAASAPAPTSTAAANAAPPVTSAANVSSLDALYSAMVTAAAPQTSLNPDQWGFYLGKVLGSPAPDAAQAFPAFSRPVDASGNVTAGSGPHWPNISAAQYWQGIAPLVAQQKGLRGLGVLAGLGAYAARRRR